MNDRAVAGRDRAALWVTVAALAVLAAVALRTEAGLGFRKYPAAAEQILSGDLDGERLIDFSPLYLGLHLAAERWLPAPELVMLSFQTLLAAVGVGVFFVVLRRRVGRGLAVLGAAMLLLNRNLLVHQSILEPEILLLFLLLVVLAAAGRPGPRASMIAGVAGALALLTRPSLLPLLALVPVAFLLEARRGGRSWSTALGLSARRAAFFALPIALAIGVLAVRSARITGSALTPAMNPGTVFFEGNNPLSFGTSAVYPPAVAELGRQPDAAGEPDRAHRFYREVARATTGQQLSVRAVNTYWRGRALAFVRAEPVRWLRLQLGKVTLAFHNVRLHDVGAAWVIERQLGLLPTVPFALVGALAMVGLLVEARRWRRSLLFYALFASQTAVMVVFYVSARQRLALVPAAVYFAVVAIERLRRPGRGLYLAVTPLLAICLLLPHPQLAEKAHQRRQGVEASARSKKLQVAFAREPPAWHVEPTIELLASRSAGLVFERPAFLPHGETTIEARVLAAHTARGETSPSARFDRALHQLAAGDAVAADRELAALADEGFVPYRLAMPVALSTYRARAAVARGDRGAAVAHLRAALAEAPGDPFALADLVALTDDVEARDRLFALWSRIDAELLLGRAYLRTGDADTALVHLDVAARALPSLRAVRFDRAVALAAVGRPDQAARLVLVILDQSVDPVLHDPAVPDLFRARLAEAPGDRHRRLAAARVLHLYGDFDEALATLAPLERDIGERLAPSRDPATLGPFERRVLAESRTLRRALAGLAGGGGSSRLDRSPTEGR